MKMRFTLFILMAILFIALGFAVSCGGDDDDDDDSTTLDDDDDNGDDDDNLPDDDDDNIPVDDDDDVCDEGKVCAEIMLCSPGEWGSHDDCVDGFAQIWTECDDPQGYLDCLCFCVDEYGDDCPGFNGNCYPECVAAHCPE